METTDICRAKTFDDLPDELISYLLSFLTYDPNLLLINKRIHRLYHLSFQIYGVNTSGLEIRFLIQYSDHDINLKRGVDKYHEEEDYAIIPFQTIGHSLTTLRAEIRSMIFCLECYLDHAHTLRDDRHKYYKLLQHLEPSITLSYGHCTLSLESRIHGLKGHDFRISILDYWCI